MTQSESVKIIFFLENNSNGGMDAFLSNLINYWPHKKDDICLVCNNDHPGKNNLRQSITKEIEFLPHNIPTAVSEVNRIFFWIPTKLRRFLRPFYKIFLFPRQQREIVLLLKKINGDRLIAINGAYPGGETCRIANLAWEKIGKPPSIHNVHNFAISPRFGFGWYESWIDRKLEKSVKQVVSVSKCCAESMRLRSAFEASEKITYIYNGVATPSDNETTSFDIKNYSKTKNTKICLMLANYEARKGHKFLFESFKLVNNQFSDVSLVICGDGTKVQKKLVKLMLEKIAPELNIHLLDFIPNGRALINQADILLIASQEWESFGLTAAEAMIRGVPVVSTNSGGLAEVIGESGKAGYSIDPSDSISYSNAIIDLLENPSKCILIGDKGRERASKLFSVERMASDYANLVRTT